MSGPAAAQKYIKYTYENYVGIYRRSYVVGTEFGEIMIDTVGGTWLVFSSTKVYNLNWSH